MVSFMADWCPACQTAKRTTFRSQKLASQVDAGHVTAIKVDLTRSNPARQRLFERYGGNAIPYLVLIDGNGNVFVTGDWAVISGDITSVDAFVAKFNASGQCL